MAFFTRARGLAVTAALAVALPTLPSVVAAPASAAPATQAAATTSAALPGSLATRKRRTNSSRAAARARVVMSHGMSLRGIPYRYGGSTPRGFDCSGFTSYVYRKAGASIPRTASAQRRAARYISKGAARAGDLVFFHSGGRVYHVGIYAGNNRVLHSPRPGRRVSVDRIWTRSVSFGRAL